MADKSYIPVVIITGFLGSGKTTLIRRVIEGYATRYRVGVIINEFAPAGVDGITLKEIPQKFILKEINNGSISCMCRQEDLVEALTRMINDHDPDLILIETSGLSDPLGVIEYFSQENLKGKAYPAYTYCLIDAANFSRVSEISDISLHQILAADELIINKSDLSNPGSLEELSEELKKINPMAGITITDHADADLAMGLSCAENKGPVAKYDKLPADPDHLCPALQVGVIRTAREISPEKAYDFLNEFLPVTLRIKGYLKLNNGHSMAVQAVYDNLVSEELSYNENSSVLVAIGNDFNIRDFNERFREYCEA